MRNDSLATCAQPSESLPAPSERRAGRRGWIVGFAVATIALYVAFLRLSWTYQVDSDGANIELMAWDMLHGNVLLHGWYAFDVPYLTTEIPQYAMLEAILGLTPVVTHAAAAMTYTLSVAGAMILAKGSAGGRAGLIRALVAGGIMLAPQYGESVFILVVSVGHIGASVPLLAILILLDRARPRRRTAVFAGLLLAWATMGDSLTYVLGSIPLAAACGYRALRSADGRRYHIELAIAALASIGLAEGGLRLVHGLGGFDLYPVPFHPTWLGDIGGHLSLTWQALLTLFGSDYHHVSGIWLAAAWLHMLGLALAGFALGWGIWRSVRMRASLVEQVLTGGIVLNLLLFALSDVAMMNAHELAVVLPFAAVLAGRAVSTVRVSRGVRRGVAVIGVAALAGQAACLIDTGNRPPIGPSQTALASFLEAHQLTYGIASYWPSSIVTADTHDRVQVRALADGFKEYFWSSKASWYDPQTNYANFIVQEKGYDFATPADAIFNVTTQFGAPERVYEFGDYLVFVYRQNLLLDLNGSSS
jgi:hypothetical protein